MNVRAFIAAATLALAATPAAAAVTQLTFSTPGGAQPQVYFAGYQPDTTTVDPALHATLDMSLTSITGGGYEWNFAYDLANTSTVMSRLSVLGFDIEPAVFTASGASGVFDKIASGNMASLGPRAFCLKDGGGNNCSGGANGGLTMGTSGSGVFRLVFQSQYTTWSYVQQPVYGKGKNKNVIVGYEQVAVPTTVNVPAPTEVKFNNFGIRMQSLANGGSTVGVPFTRPNSGGGLGGAAIPEPATWAMMILGFGAAGAVIRRRRSLARNALAV